LDAISVALVTSKRNLQDHLKLCCQEKRDLKKESAKLQEYKDGKEAEERKAKKVEKKGRQKEKREALKKESCEADTVKDFEATDELLSNVDISNPFEMLQKQNLGSKPASKTVDQDQNVKAKDPRAENVECVEEPEVAMIMSKVPPDPEIPTSKFEPDNVLGMNVEEFSVLLNKMVDKYTGKITE
jgi:hypothetical protein